MDRCFGRTRTLRRKRYVLTLALFTLSMEVGAAHLAAQDRVASVQGVVGGEDMGSLEGAHVEILGLDRRGVTDGDGRFTIRDVPAGEYTLRISLLGWKTREVELHVQGSSIRVEPIVLEPEAIVLSPVIVIEQRTRLAGISVDIPGAVEVLDGDALESTASAHDDIHQFLRQIPGVNVQEEDGFGLRPNIGMRGSGSERSSKITVMEDGVLIAPAPYAAPAAYYFPVAGRMSAIEVRKGSSQIKYGPRTIGGVLNLVSSPIPTGFEWAAEGALGADVTRRLHARAGGASDHVGWLAETYQLGSSGFKRIPGGGPTGFDVHDYLGKLRFHTDPASTGLYQQIDFKVGAYHEWSDETYLGLTDADFETKPFLRYAASREDVMRVKQTQISARHFLRLGTALDVTTTAYRHDVSRNWYKLQSVRGTGISSLLVMPDTFGEELAILRGGGSEPGDLRVRANNRAYDARGVQMAVGSNVSTLDVDHHLEAGVRYHWDREDRFQHEDAYTMTAGQMALATRGAPGSQSNRVSEASAWAFYLEDRIDLGRLTLTPGFRLETIDFTRTEYATDDPDRGAPTRVRENGVDAFLPGIGASVRAGDVTRLFAGVHRGFGPPGPGADGETKAEASVNYEVGAAFEGVTSEGKLVFFFNDYGNVLGAATLSSGSAGTGDLFNGGAARIWGVEASAHRDLARHAWRVRIPLTLAYTYTSAEFLTSFDSDFEEWGTVRKGDRLPYLAPHQLFGSLGFGGDAWSVRLAATYNDRMRTVAGRGPISEGEGTDAFLVLNLGAEVAVGGLGTVFAGIQNLTDDRYLVARRPAGARPGLPRMLEVGLRLGH